MTLSSSFLISVFTSLAFGTFLQCSASAETANYSASPAPGYFVTQNHSLIVHLPSYAFRCSIPPQNVGSDNGIIIYLAKPNACSKQTFGATGPNAKYIPKITIFYSYNVVPVTTNSSSNIPGNDFDLMTEYCKNPIKETSLFTLFGHQPVACVKRNGKKIEFTVGSLYFQSQANPGDPPDSLLTIELDTSVRQFRRNMKKLAFIASSLQTCGIANKGNSSKYQKCPPQSNW